MIIKVLRQRRNKFSWPLFSIFIIKIIVEKRGDTGGNHKGNIEAKRISY